MMMKSKLILILALLMGAITTYLFYNYMKQFDSATKINDNTVEVVVAKQKIKENTMLTADLVEVIQLPENGIHAQAIRELSSVKGYATADIEAGEQILAHRMKEAKEEELFVSKKIKEGYRAVSVGLNIVQSVTNLIEPEDYVDIVSSIKNENTNEIHSQIILKKVRVLAIGRKLIESTSKEEYVEYTAVTLELKPEESVRLINAAEQGNVQMILHTRVTASKGE